jgi:putative toxin-antitoxin system antitoxin component (TIGR02293 family)
MEKASKKPVSRASLQVVKEPASRYDHPMFSVILGGARAEYEMSALEKMALIEAGISKKALEALKQHADLDYDQLAQVLNVARATLINKKGDARFSLDISDKILGLAEIYSYGYQVFEDRDKFNEWIFRSNRALGNHSPFNFLHNSFGREEIKHLIGRIEYGVYS